MPPPIHFALTEDEVSIAYSVHGEGPPLVYVRGWISHLDLMWLFPDYRIFMEALARHFTVIRFDMRGNGLSERHVSGRLALDDLALDIIAVLDAVGVDRATFLASCYGGPIFARFASLQPDRIDRVVLDGTYAKGDELATPETRESVLATVRLMETQPGMATTLLSYYTNRESRRRGDEERQRGFGPEAINADVATELYELSFSLDVSKDLLALNAPTLVTHRRDSKAVPAELGRKVAALVPRATYVGQEGRQTNPWDGDATHVLDSIGDFLGVPLAVGYFPRIVIRPTVVLFSDMVDSTKTSASRGDIEAHNLNRAFHSISREALDVRGGRLVKSTGDGIMAEFPSVSQALGCAVDMQTTFAAFADAHPGDSFQVRIGINAGEPLSEDDDLHGLVVSTAARICDEGLGGEVLVSNVVRELAIGKGFTFVDRGRHELRGVGEPVHLFRVDF